MQACMHARTSGRAHEDANMRTHTRAHTHEHAHTHAHTHTCMHASAHPRRTTQEHTGACTHACTSTHEPACTPACTRARTQTQTQTHAGAHAHARTCRLFGHLEARIFLPNEVACTCGDVAKNMFLIQRGDFCCLSDAGSSVKSNGEIFGEEAMIARRPRCTATVKAVTYADTLRLPRRAFVQMFNDRRHPDFRISVVQNLDATKHLRGWALIRICLTLRMSIRDCYGACSMIKFEELVRTHIEKRDDCAGLKQSWLKRLKGAAWKNVENMSDSELKVLFGTTLSAYG